MTTRAASSPQLDPGPRPRFPPDDEPRGHSASARSADQGAAERRRFARIASVRVPTVTLQGISARLLDLGLGGALVESPVRPIPGAITSLRLTARDVNVHARACIRRASVAGFVQTSPFETAPLYRSGIEFQALSSTDIRAVEAVLLKGGAIAHDFVQPDRERAPLVSVQFPAGWSMTTRKDTVVASKPNARGFMFLRTIPNPPADDACTVARIALGEAGFSALDCREVVINGLIGCLGFFHGRLRDLGEVLIEAAVVSCGGQLHLLAGVSAWVEFESMRHEFATAIRTLEKPSSPVVESSEDAEPDSNRRRSVRCAGPFDGRRAGLLETPIRIYDLSEGGCFINALHETATNGQRMDLKIQLPFEGWINVKAVALYTRPEFRFAVRFVDLPGHTRERIVRAVQKLQALRK
jgi:PilZ domain-containing protein